MRKYLILYIMLSCLPMAARGQTIPNLDLSGVLLPPMQAQSLQYWFDGDTDNMQTASGLSGTYTLDVTSLADGLHILHYQVTGTDGKTYALSSDVFLKLLNSITNSNVAASKLHYWFDYDAEKMQTASGLSGTCLLDVATLSDGLHTLYYQLIGTDGETYALSSVLFLKLMSIADPIASESLVAEKMKYWFNNDYASTVQTDVVNGIQTIDVSALPEGLHTLHYQVVYDNGHVGPTVSGIFLKNIKMPGLDVENRITKYQYWQNDNYSNLQNVVLTNAQNPYSLISLLPVVKMPIRSSSFHFEVKDGQPTIYALNDFHIRFFDELSYFVEDGKKYIDYSIMQSVEPIGELQATQTFDKVTNNAIRWYTVSAEPGDTLIFKSSQATTIQLFSPAGQELYKAEGPTSVVYGGCHTWESGTHYLAVHDVMGSKPSMTLDYMHMDKYDVVDWDAHVVGNGGYNSITFKGNGFHDLQSVDLVLGTTIISSDSIGYESDAETSVRFDFDGAELGEYNAIFHFVDDDLEVENCLTVEEAREIELEGSASFAKTFLYGVGNTYTFKIHNKSNMTAYDVPIGIGVFTPIHMDDSTHMFNIHVTGYDVFKQYHKILGEHYTDSLNRAIQEKRKLSGEVFCFVDDTVPDYFPGFPYEREAFITKTVRPYSTETFQVYVRTQSNMCVYAWMPSEGPMKQSNTIKHIRRKASSKEECTSQEMALDAMCYNERMKIATYPNMPKGFCNKPRKDCGYGGNSDGEGSKDPNDILGYLSGAGSLFMADTVSCVNYTIEFENDSMFATAPAHTILIRDTLDGRYFDLNSFVPTMVRIGSHDLLLDDKVITTNSGVISFVKTIDMRPEIYAIAQVEGEYNQTSGIAEWRFTSLDPMTMEPAEDVMQGILPVNYDGMSGIGEVMFEIGMKQGKVDGTEIPNRASITFDANDPILTPTWTNTVDAIAPTSTILGAIQAKTDTLTLRIAGEDNRSGVWRYDVYAQIGQGSSWEKVAENVPAILAEGETETLVDVRIFEGIEYGFMVLATDSAGNVERKAFEAEFELSTVKLGDANGDGVVDALDVVLAISYYLGEDVYLNFAAADVVADGEINALDVVAMQDIYLNTSHQALAPRKRKVKSQQLEQRLQ